MGVCRSSFGPNRGDARQKLGLFADAGEKVCVSDAGDVVGDFEVATRPSSFGVYHSFRDPFA
jgi:hypothetical protein